MVDINKFEIEISSNLDYENMIAYIVYDNETIAIISQETKLMKFDIEIVEGLDRSHRCYDLEQFLLTINFAKNKLIEFES